MSRPVVTEAAIAYHNLVDRLPDVQPYMFSLADSLVEAAPDAQWNVLIGDDASGRLPTYFIRKVLTAADLPLPLHFVAGSKQLRDQVPASAYRERFRTITQSLGSITLRPLVLTESVGSGTTLGFITDELRHFSEHIETASVSAVDPAITATYTGGIGPKAWKAVYFTFESSALATPRRRLFTTMRASLPQCVKDLVPRDIKRIGNWPSNDLLGLYADQATRLPLCQRRGDNPYTAQAYRLMDDLVAAYQGASLAHRETNELSRI